MLHVGEGHMEPSAYDTQIQLMDAPKGVAEEDKNFEMNVFQWTTFYKELGTLPATCYFETTSNLWAARHANNTIPMPRSGATVIVEGYLTGVERDEHNKSLRHIDVSIENVHFAGSSRPAPTLRPFGQW